MWFFIIMGVFLIVMGLTIHVFKWYFLISGYNTMPEEKKANVDVKGLGRLIGIYFYVNGAVSIAAGVFYALEPGKILISVIAYLVFFDSKKLAVVNLSFIIIPSSVLDSKIKKSIRQD